jgi:hypothetical protein
MVCRAHRSRTEPMSNQHLSKLIDNAETFAEKAKQVTPDSLVAFGMEIESRYGKCEELIELLRFAQAAALASVAHYVKVASYDSKASICTFELDPAIVRGTEVEARLLSIAREHVRHFAWFENDIFDGDGPDA